MNRHEYTAQYLEGTQRIIPNKRLNETRDFVTILMTLIRVPKFEADFLITLNVPDKTSADANGETEVYKEIVEMNKGNFKKIVESLTVPSEVQFNELFPSNEMEDI